MLSQLKGNDECEKFLLGMMLTAALGCLLILFYSLCFWASGQLIRILGVGLLVAGAALFSGFLLGFIFAIPRMGDKGKAATGQPQGSLVNGSFALLDSMPFNDNLVEISDWLTKIIVGVGLVELRSIPDKIGELSCYLAPGLLPFPSEKLLMIGQAAGLAILIYYFTGGFLTGYVWTTINFRRYLRHVIEQLERHLAAVHSDGQHLAR
jgi:hypothetical protein